MTCSLTKRSGLRNRCGFRSGLDLSPHTIISLNLRVSVFQQLEIDYENGESHKELLPDSSGQAPIIRIFGVTKEGHSVCCLVHGFEPYLYIACPPGIGPDNISRLHQILEGRMRESNRYCDALNSIRRIEIMHKRSIMYYQQQKSQTFLKIVVALPTMVATCRGILDKGIQIDGLSVKRFQTYETTVPFDLRFMIDLDIVGGNWIEVPFGKYKTNAKTLSYCQLEFDCLYSDLISHAAEGEYSKMAPFRVLSFDIECAGRKGHFPEPKHDPVIQVANIVTLQGENVPFVRNVMTLKSCDPIEGANVMSFEIEREVLLAWRDFIREVDPDIIIGYNICKFDLPYLIERAATLGISEFPFLGRVKKCNVCVKNAHFSSRQHGTRESKEITIEGRLQFDLFQAIQRGHKLSSYSLNSVSAHILSEQKEDIHHSIITDLHNGNVTTRKRLAVYCLKDAYLPQRLLDKLKYIYSYVEMACRNAATAPSVGDRVPYVIVKAAKGAKAYERSEDPIYVLENNIPIDTNYYLENQIKKPILRIFELVLENASNRLFNFSGRHMRSKSIDTPSNIGIMKFAKKQPTCMGCKARIRNGTVCSDCEGREVELHIKQVCQVAELEELVGSLRSHCQECTSPIFYRRVKATKDLEATKQQFDRWSF